MKRGRIRSRFDSIFRLLMYTDEVAPLLLEMITSEEICIRDEVVVEWDGDQRYDIIIFSR